MDPGISCLMPTTAARRWCLPLAIQWFQRQSYEGPTELVVVSEDLAELDDLLPMPHVRAVSCARGTPLGAKHNIAAAAARHPWLAKWDDDDWQAPTRLEVTMRAAMASCTELVSAAPVIYYELATQRAWEFRYLSERPWQPGNSMLFSRGLWSRVRFEDERNRGIDTLFLYRALERETTGVTVEGAVATVVLRHGQETGLTWDPKPPEWVPWDGDCRMLLGADLPAIEEAYRERAPHNLRLSHDR